LAKERGFAKSELYRELQRTKSAGERLLCTIFAELQAECWRHTFGTRCAESGMDRHTLAKLMGHSSPRITEKYYIHVTEPHLSSGFDRFMAYQAKRLGTGPAMDSAQ
jgi:integrase